MATPKQAAKKVAKEAEVRYKTFIKQAERKHKSPFASEWDQKDRTRAKDLLGKLRAANKEADTKKDRADMKHKFDEELGTAVKKNDVMSLKSLLLAGALATPFLIKLARADGFETIERLLVQSLVNAEEKRDGLGRRNSKTVYYRKWKVTSFKSPDGKWHGEASQSGSSKKLKAKGSSAGDVKGNLSNQIDKIEGPEGKNDTRLDEWTAKTWGSLSTKEKEKELKSMSASRLKKFALGSHNVLRGADHKMALKIYQEKT